MRRERELRGISLEEIAANTKIGSRWLRALEDEQFEQLPGGIFNKNYVRAYARHVGIDEEQAIADYLRAARETPPDVRLIAHQNSAMHGRYNPDNRFARRGFPLVPLLILLVVIAGVAGGWRLYQQRQAERVQSLQQVAATQAPGLNPKASSASAGSASPTEKAAIPQPTTSPSESGMIHTVEAAESSSHTGSRAAAQSSALNDELAAPFAVTVRAKHRAQVEVKSDGEVVVRGVIEPSETKTFHATSRLVFWTANAGGVEISFNGKNVPLSGGENEERVLIFNARGLLPRMAAQ